MKEAALFAGVYFSTLIEDPIRMTRDDAMAMTNNFVAFFLMMRGVIPKVGGSPKEPWQ